MRPCVRVALFLKPVLGAWLPLEGPLSAGSLSEGNSALLEIFNLGNSWFLPFQALLKK